MSKNRYRNSECWCGNGIKYKKCHLAYDEKIMCFYEQGYIIPDKRLIFEYYLMTEHVVSCGESHHHTKIDPALS